MNLSRTGRLATAALTLVTVVLPAPAASAANSLGMLGADVSTAQRALDLGAKYTDAAGVARDPLDILKGAGVNYVRLRVWNNPRSGYNTKAKVLQYARAVKAKGATLTTPDKAKFIALIAPIQDEVASELKTADLLQLIRTHAK